MKNRLCRICPPLLPVAVLLGTGIWIGSLPFFSFSWIVSASTAFFFWLLAICIFRFSTIIPLTCLAALIWGALSMGRIAFPTLPDHHISKFNDGKGKVITGKVVSFSLHYRDKTRLVLACSQIIEKGGTPQAVSGLIRLSIYGTRKERKSAGPQFGDEIRFFSRLRPIRNFANPGGYDYEAHMRYRGIFGSANTQAGKIKILPREDGGFTTRFFRRAELLRNNFSSRVRALAGGNRLDAAAVLTALVTGKKENIPLRIKDHFARAGVSHLLAISGFHLSIFALGFFLFLNAVFSRIPLLAVTGYAKKAAGIMTLLPVAAYAVFTGFSPSTQRALAMVAAFMAALAFEKEKDGLNILCLAAVVILAFDPPALFSISFQLSFAAVVFIIIGFTTVYEKKWMPKNFVFAWFWSIVLVTIFAGLGTLPLIARYFNMVSCIQVLANLVVVPLMGFICLPLGIAGFLLDGMIWPGGASWVMYLAIELIEWCLELIRYVAGFPFAWVRVVTPKSVDLVLIYLFMAAVYLTVFIRKKAAFIFMAVVVTAATLSLGYQLRLRYFPGALNITVLDVGQGNAAIVRTPGGHAILIDGGGFSGNSGFDTGRFILGPFLWAQRIISLDAVILTHPQADHMNGLVFILENFKVRKLIRNRDDNDTEAFRALLALIQKQNIPQYFPEEKGLSQVFDKVCLQVLPSPDQASAASLDLNSNSVVCRFSFGDFSMLFPGDIEQEREAALVDTKNSRLGATLLLAPHHGSRTSSSTIFLDKVKPQGVIISCGHKNRYGFPHSCILQKYRERGAAVFRTDLHGAISVTSSGIGYDINTHRKSRFDVKHIEF